MGHNKNFPRVCALAISVCMGAAITNTTDSLAAGKHKPQAAPASAAPAAGAQQDEAAQKQKEAAAAHASYEAGVKSYQAGKYEPAVQSLSAALRGGGLSSTDMAHALFYRGVAYKKQSKPGLAISDLTSSLWLKNGLADAERANATAERADAYRLAGLGDGNSGAETVSVPDPNKSAAAKTVSESAPAGAAAAAPQAQRAAVQPTPKESLGAQSYVSTSVADGTAAPAPRPSRAPQGDQLLAAINQNQPDLAPAPAAASTPVLSAVPMEQADTSATATSGAASTVSGFFSNMFGGGKSAPASVTTASTTPAAATSGWNDTTSTAGSVAAGKTAKAATGAKVAAAGATPAFTTSAAVPAPVTAAAPVKGGKFKIHVAAVRSKAEAEALAQKLVQQHGAALANRSPTVDEAVIGSMGTFYRVRIGSFATAEEPRGLCNTLRTSGVDCLVVTN